MSNDPADLSLKLCAVLEKIGVSESMRKIYRDTSISGEIIRTLSHRMRDRNVSLYIFGSSCEGTTTPSMGSDVDLVTCDEDLPVIEDIQEAPAGDALLMLTSSCAQPGYVHLQLVENGRPLTIHNYNIEDNEITNTQNDSEGRICLTHVTRQGKNKFVDERNGPADTVSTSNPRVPPQDHVYALKSKTFPQIAIDSLEKCVACGWVSRDDVEKMKKFGILLVGVGFQSSMDREIEWRMSLSFQERGLMLALNPTQHKCYVMLKTTKILITANPDVGKSLTSYHCKTCLFTVITNTSKALWREDNIIKCICICLCTLKSWIYRGNCPNFFIPESNMFDRNEFRQAQERLLYYMRQALHEWPRLLYQIESDHLGDALRGMTGTQIDENRTRQAYDVLKNACEVTCRYHYGILEYCQKLPSNQHLTRYLFQQLCHLTCIDTFIEHTEEQTQMALRYLEPVLHKLFAQHLASVAFSTDLEDTRERLVDATSHHLKKGKNCDVLSVSLLVATMLYRRADIEDCWEVLEQVEQQILHDAVVSLCQCHAGGMHYRNAYLKRNVSSGAVNPENIMKSAAAPCMIFLPSQSEIIPTALQYEMYRSVYAPTDSRDTIYNKWFDFAVVDSKIYMYFMQYLVYARLKQPVARQAAIDHIMKTMGDDPNLQHKDTAYNLLGWICIQEGLLQEAFVCLCNSWEIRPDHNAAKWHLPALLLRLFALL